MRVICFLFSLLFLISSSYADQLREMRAYGSSIIKNENDDMWDKKNDAIYNAKKRATLQLAQKAFKPETLESLEKRITKEIAPYSGNYIISTEVLSHGVEEEGEFKAYNAKVLLKYSFENFKNFLLRKGMKPDNLKQFKVAAFIEVLDETNVQSHTWWNQKSPSLHPVLKPLQDKLAVALKEEGYDLLPIRVFNGDTGMKDMAKAMGAQYYINGSVKIEESVPSKFKVKGGLFNFHEALSQKLVSQVDLKKFSQAFKQEPAPARPTRGLASVEPQPKRKDVIKEAFKDAARTMNSVENVEQLSQGLAKIQIEGLNSPVQLKVLKETIYSNLRDDMSTLVEREIKNGSVTLYMRTGLSPRRLLQKMVFMRSQGYQGEVSDDGESVHFRKI